MSEIVTVVSTKYAGGILLAARNGSASMSSDQEKNNLREILEEMERRSLSDEQIRGLEITFLILVTIGLILITRL